MLTLERYSELALRPTGRAVMRQRWKNLLFLHAPVSKELLQSLLPQGLEIDTFEGEAYIGLVPFEMSEVRPNGLPAVHGLSYFPETNVRTYVTYGNETPGVWFFSLDARQRLAVAIARTFFALPYFNANMTASFGNGKGQFFSERTDGSGIGLSASFSVDGPFDKVRPGTLDYWLLERYLLFSERKRQLFAGRVHHAPYEVCSVSELQITQNLIQSHKILDPGEWPHRCFAETVEVEVFPLRRLPSRSQ